MCDEVEVSTWVQCSVNRNLNSDTKLDGNNRIQDASNPFVLPRYRVSSVIVRTSEHTQIDEERQTFESGRFERRRR